MIVVCLITLILLVEVPGPRSCNRTARAGQPNPNRLLTARVIVERSVRAMLGGWQTGQRARSGSERAHVNDKSIAHVAPQQPGVRLFYVLHGNLLDVRHDIARGAEVEHLLGFFYAADG